MKLFSRLQFRFVKNFIRIFIKNSWNQVMAFVDLLGLLIFFIPRINSNFIVYLIWFTGFSFLGVTVYILVKRQHKILVTPKKIFLEHTYHINALALSSDEEKIASCSGDHYAILWDLNTSKPIFRMIHSSWVGNLTFSPDNRFLYTLDGAGGRIHQWDLGTKEEIYSKLWFERIGREKKLPQTRGMSLSGDGSRMAISSNRGSFVYFNPTDKDFFAMPIKVSDFNLRRVLLREERVFLASSGGELFLINITNQSNWEVNKIYQDKNHEIIRDIDIHYDGEILAFTDSGGWLRILNFENDRLCSVMAHNGHAVSVCFNKTGHFLATGGQDNIINLWGFHNGKIKKLFEIHGHRDTVTSLVFNSKNQLFSASRDQSIKQWDLKGLE